MKNKHKRISNHVEKHRNTKHISIISNKYQRERGPCMSGHVNVLMYAPLHAHVEETWWCLMQDGDVLGGMVLALHDRANSLVTTRHT